MKAVARRASHVAQSRSEAPQHPPHGSACRATRAQRAKARLWDAARGAVGAAREPGSLVGSTATRTATRAPLWGDSGVTAWLGTGRDLRVAPPFWEPVNRVAELAGRSTSPALCSRVFGASDSNGCAVHADPQQAAWCRHARGGAQAGGAPTMPPKWHFRARAQCAGDGTMAALACDTHGQVQRVQRPGRTRQDQNPVAHPDRDGTRRRKKTTTKKDEEAKRGERKKRKGKERREKSGCQPKMRSRLEKPRHATRGTRRSKAHAHRHDSPVTTTTQGGDRTKHKGMHKRRCRLGMRQGRGALAGAGNPRVWWRKPGCSRQRATAVGKPEH